MICLQDQSEKAKPKKIEFVIAPEKLQNVKEVQFMNTFF